MKPKKYRQLKKLDGIKVGLATSFNAGDGVVNDVEVLGIFPDGTDYTTTKSPYYVQCKVRGLLYFSRKQFKESNIK